MSDPGRFPSLDHHNKDITFGPRFIAIVCVLSFMTVAILLGNALVIVSVILFRKLRKTLTSYLILSLAVADVSVGALILPFSTVNSVLGEWIFGEIWCRIWLMLDVFMCTASIYNLVAISIDRYFAIVRPMAYPRLITTRKICCMIFTAWIVSFLICIPPVFLSNEASDNETFLFPADENKHPTVCTPLRNPPTYVIFSAFGSFYLPMALIIILYTRIFLAARKVSLATAKGYMAVSLLKCVPRNFPLNQKIESCSSSSSASSLQPNVLTVKSSGVKQEVLRIHRGKYTKSSFGRVRKFSNLLRRNSVKDQLPPIDETQGRNSLNDEIRSAPIAASLIFFGGITPVNSITNPINNMNSAVAKMVGRKSFIRKLKVEIRSAKTVAVITGCFITSWLGFAIIYLLSAFPFCPNNSCVPEWLSGFFFWMGYVNSGLNVIIYAFFSKQFRGAFMHILHLHKCC